MQPFCNLFVERATRRLNGYSIDEKPDHAGACERNNDRKHAAAHGSKISPPARKICSVAAIAQLVERELPKLEVAGSRPVRRSRQGLCCRRRGSGHVAERRCRERELVRVGTTTCFAGREGGVCRRATWVYRRPRLPPANSAAKGVGCPNLRNQDQGCADREKPPHGWRNPHTLVDHTPRNWGARYARRPTRTAS